MNYPALHESIAALLLAVSTSGDIVKITQEFCSGSGLKVGRIVGALLKVGVGTFVVFVLWTAPERLQSLEKKLGIEMSELRSKVMTI